MEYFFSLFNQRLRNLPGAFTRKPVPDTAWNNRLIGIKGARGVGKTTLLLQYARKNLPLDYQTLYLSLDDIYFRSNTLSALVSDFVKSGGKYLILDEVHKYADWSIEIKSIYDNHPDLLRIIFTGSSIIEISKAPADLSRRVVMFEMPGLSFREFLFLETGHYFEAIDLELLLKEHVSLAREINSKIKPLLHFQNYLMYGYYPYYLENKEFYHQKVMQDVSHIIESDLAYTEGIGIAHQEKLKKLLFILASNPPFKPNISKLTSLIGISRNTLMNSLHILHKARLLGLLYADPTGITLLQKPEKIFLFHPNLYYTLSRQAFDTGSLRETFFYNQVQTKHGITYPKEYDFLVDDHLLFEIGGKNKKVKSVMGEHKVWIVKDNIEYGYRNQLPLWLFGFLY